MAFDPRAEIGTTLGYGTNQISALVYGPAGAGKTTLAATTGDPARTLVLAAEPGLLPLRNVGVRFVEIDGPEKLHEVLAWLESAGLKLSKRWAWVILDSISEIAERVLKSMMSRPSKSGDKGHGMAAYGETQSTMLDAMKRVRNLPTNTLTVAKQERVEDGEQRLIYGPMFPGKKLAGQSVYEFDLVMALRVSRDEQTKQVTRWLQTQADGKYEAKDRSGALQPAEPPDLAHIAATILASMPLPQPEAIAPEANREAQQSTENAA